MKWIPFALVVPHWFLQGKPVPRRVIALVSTVARKTNTVYSLMPFSDVQIPQFLHLMLVGYFFASARALEIFFFSFSSV